MGLKIIKFSLFLFVYLVNLVILGWDFEYIVLTIGVKHFKCLILNALRPFYKKMSKSLSLVSFYNMFTFDINRFLSKLFWPLDHKINVQKN